MTNEYVEKIEAVVGFDFGNQYACGVFVFRYKGKIQRRVITIPSHTCFGSARAVSDLRTGRSGSFNKDPYSDFKNQKGLYTLSWEGKERFVGRAAPLYYKAHASTGSGDFERYHSKRFQEVLYTLAAAAIPSEHFSLYVVTGLPLSLNQTERRNKVIAALPKKGIQQIGFLGSPRFIHGVEIARILSESLGPAILYDIPENETWAIIDPGYGTTDYAVMTGATIDTQRCGTMKVGMNYVVQYINESCQREYGETLSFLQMQQCLYAYEKNIDRSEIPIEKEVKGYTYIQTEPNNPNGDYPSLTYENGDIPKSELVRWTEEGMENLGRLINEELSIKWGANASGKIATNFKGVHCVGGSTRCLWKIFSNVIPLKKIHMSLRPETDTAKGYSILGEELVGGLVGEESEMVNV